MKLPIVRCAAKPSTRPSTADEARIAAGDRAHLRDHEQRREDADEDDRRRRSTGAGSGSAWPPPA